MDIPHDTEVRGHIGIGLILQDLGMAGYGIYWALYEELLSIGATPQFALSNLCTPLSNHLDTPRYKIRKVLELMVQHNLFCVHPKIQDWVIKGIYAHDAINFGYWLENIIEQEITAENTRDQLLAYIKLREFYYTDKEIKQAIRKLAKSEEWKKSAVGATILIKHENNKIFIDELIGDNNEL